jgi:Domain of unknown function (DUF5919)
LEIPVDDLIATVDRLQSGKQATSIASVRARARQQEAQALETWGEVQEICRTRTAFAHEWSYPSMFESAQDVVAVGISLNAIALTYSWENLIQSITSGRTRYRLCFLDPDGRHCREREEEEGLDPGSLSDLTRLNLRHLHVIQRRLCEQDPAWCDWLQLYTYDLAPRYNLYMVNNALLTVQSDGCGRGEDTPTFVLRRTSDEGLFDFYAGVARYILAHARPLEASAPQ